jgi:cell division protein FtsI/penicillin-binding protein 2
MRDLKNFNAKKRWLGFLFTHRREKPSLNSYKRLIEPKRDNPRLRLILPLLATILAAYPLFNLFISTRTALSSVSAVAPQQPQRVEPARELNDWQSFQLAAEALPVARFDGNRFVAPLMDGGKVIYAIDRDLQERVKKVMDDFKVPYGVFIALEPKTGRVLAMASHSSLDPQWEKRSFFDIYPMASLFKIITAAAALEQKRVTPETVVAFRGKLTSENPRYWCNPGRRAQQMDLTTAMGKSVNPIFGRVAGELVGKDCIVSSAERFGFNQLLFPGGTLPASRIQAPQSDAELMRMGAGLCHDVKISPLHAAALMAGIANNGTMMLPILAEGIVNGAGERLFTEKSLVVRQVSSPEIARQLGKMMSSTVNSGTSRKVFHDRRGKAKLASLNIAAKTGSINGTDPSGHYSWFAAYAPMEDPQIALAALVINQGKWKIKASYLGEQALEAFFK